MPNPGRGSSDDPADDPQESPTVIEPVADPTVIPGHPPPDESPTVYEPIDRLSLRKSMQNPTEQVAPPTSAGPTSVGPTAVEHTSLGPAAPYRATQVNPSTPFPALGPLPAGPQPAGPPPAGPPYGPPPGMPPGYQGGPPMPPAPPRRKRSRAPWIVSGVVLVLVAALVAGGVVWWQHRSSDDDDQPALLAGQLTGSYPTAPSPTWSVTASDFGGAQFVATQTAKSQYLVADAIHDDHTIVTMVGAGPGQSSQNRSLVGIDAVTGAKWTYSRSMLGCAEAIVGGTLVCYDENTIDFIDARTGARQDQVAMPANYFGPVAYNGDAVFVSGFDGDHQHIAKVTRRGVTWQQQVTDPGEFYGSGDSTKFIATKDWVAYGGGRVTVLSADSGREILSRSGSAQIAVLPDESVAVVEGSTSGGISAVLHVRPDGSIQQLAGGGVSVATIATPEQRGRALVGGSYVDLADGQTLWRNDSTDASQQDLVLADNREAVLLRGNEVSAVDITTGRTIWTAETGRSPSTDRALTTDGERVMVASESGGLQALNLLTGASEWTLAASTLGNNSEGGTLLVMSVGGRLVTLAREGITAFAPTGPRAIVPGTTRKQSTDNGNGSGGTEYVTPCGSPPKFTPQSFRTSSGGLGVTMKVSATCPGGDILWGPQTRITIKDGNDLVASGNFDFSQTPVAVPSLDDAGTGLTMELTYPPGSFYRLPDTLSTQASTDRFLVDCDKGPTTGQPPRLTVPDEGSAATTATATGPSLPPGTDLTAASVDALRVQANSDRAFILTNLNNRWVAQLSSKRPGLNAEGRIWDNQAILDEFLALRLRFSDVRLLYSDEWPVFNYRGWWVTVAAATFPGPDAANNWCRAQGFTKDHCFAKLISSTRGPEGSTRYWS